MTAEAPPQLSPREKQIMQCVARGMTDNGIAAHLKISTHTVNQHFRHIFVKFGVNSRAAVAARCGLCLDDPQQPLLPLP
jgi:DNA-binding CsgD family transcriptional regulator